MQVRKRRRENGVGEDEDEAIARVGASPSGNQQRWRGNAPYIKCDMGLMKICAGYCGVSHGAGIGSCRDILKSVLQCGEVVHVPVMKVSPACPTCSRDCSGDIESYMSSGTGHQCGRPALAAEEAPGTATAAGRDAVPQVGGRCDGPLITI